MRFVFSLSLLAVFGFAYADPNPQTQIETDASKQSSVTDSKKESSSCWDLNCDGYHEIIKKSKTKFELGATTTIALFKVNNAQYGVGSKDLNNPDVRRFNPEWLEAYVSPNARLTQGLDDGSTLYGRLSTVAATTRGQGDPINPSTTSNKPFLHDHEEAVIGWRSGTITKKEDLFDLSVGDQSLIVGDGFLVGDGTSDAYRRSATYLGPRTAFRNTAVLKINTLPVRGQVFHLSNYSNQKYLRGTDQPKTFLYGGNVEYVSVDSKETSKENWTIGAMALYLYQADRAPLGGTQDKREGLQVYNPRIGGNFFPQNRDIRFFAGYVYEKNNKSERKVNANAYYVEPAYTFSKIWWTPLILYRFTHYSGDENPNGLTKKSYDPLFYAFSTRDGFGTWENGQIQGNFYLANTNQNVHSVQLKLTPTKELTLGAQYFVISYDKLQQGGCQSKRVSNEVNAFATWSPTDRLSFTALVGAVMPKSGLVQQTIANNSDVKSSQIGKTTYMGFLKATFKI